MTTSNMEKLREAIAKFRQRVMLAIEEEEAKHRAQASSRQSIVPARRDTETQEDDEKQVIDLIMDIAEGEKERKKRYSGVGNKDDAKRASPKRASPKRASQKRASPKRASPKRASQKRASPKRASPKKEEPNKAFIKKRSSKRKSSSADSSTGGWFGKAKNERKRSNPFVYKEL